MAKVKCSSCNGTGNAYNGFGDAPFKKCEPCGGTGFTGTEDKPFRLTDNERVRIEDVLCNVKYNGFAITLAIYKIESIIAEEVDNVS